jgi:hypothetical protein
MAQTFHLSSWEVQLMPINFQQAREQIRKMGENASARSEAFKDRLEQAVALLQEYSAKGEILRQLVEQAALKNAALRCAIPTEEHLDGCFEAPKLIAPVSLLAADGSQINPDRSSPVEFGAINVGAIRLRNGEVARETIQSRLLFDDEIRTEDGYLGDDVVALMRDLEERKKLVELAASEPGPVVTLTDGPLELFHGGRDDKEFGPRLAEYKEVLVKLADLGTATAGYVDKPRSDLIVRLLELVLLLRTGEINEAGRKHPLFPVSDRDLLVRLLRPGQRSGVYELRSVSAQSFSGRLALHFFYLNVGREKHPYLARVEIPRWVAETPALLDLLHGVLLAQSAQMGASPYPYILHRAHEIAVVSFQEKEQVETMIIGELRRQGLAVGDRSPKQTAKDSSHAR